MSCGITIDAINSSRVFTVTDGVIRYCFDTYDQALMQIKVIEDFEIIKNEEYLKKVRIRKSWEREGIF